ncbi:MAG: hypothetical protein KF832_14205 [Caldilineaceae bacterium]|nr:hypothetical protein [Caldilineaceae bacterium]
MSVYFILIVALLSLGFMARGWKQRLRLGQPKSTASTGEPSTNSHAPTPMPLQVRATQTLAALRERFSRGAQPDLALRFRAWVTATLTEDADVQRWLQRLPPDALLAFTQQVAEFCDEMGFQLADLVDGTLNQMPATADKAKAIVVSYCRANYQAAGAQADFDALKRFFRYVHAPAQKENQQFGQALYARLVQKQAAPPPSFDTAMASATQRQAYILNAIQQAAAQQPQIFTAALKEVVAQSQAAPTSEEQTMAAAPGNA